MGVAVNQAEFRAAMARFPGAVTIVTTRTLRGERRGITATAVCSVTDSPPSLLVCINRKTGTCAAIAETGFFNINLLPDPSHALALRFAGKDGATGEEKFTLGDWRDDARGVPVLWDACVAFSCEVTQSVIAGTHQVFIGRIVAIQHGPGKALLWEQSRFSRLVPL